MGLRFIRLGSIIIPDTKLQSSVNLYWKFEEDLKDTKEVLSMNISIKNFIKSVLVLLVAVCIVFISACNNVQESNVEETAAVSTTAIVNTAAPIITTETPATSTLEPTIPEPTPDMSLYAVNPLTGMKNMSKDNVGKRPLAIMINNVKQATPQSGITACDIYYELPAEGQVPRIMGVFSDLADIPAEIGPIRSTRDYYVALAIGYNAVLVNFGTSTSADSLLKNYSWNNLDGMFLSNMYWRDAVRRTKNGYEHSVMMSGEKISQTIKQKKWNLDTGINGGAAFSFYDENNHMIDGTTDCTKAIAKYNGTYSAEFNYDANTKLYGKSQLGAPHVDSQGNQIKVTNVIILYTKITTLPDKAGHLSIDLSSGSGYYISGGKSKEIKWSKGDVTNPIKYMNTDGTDLKVNAGKTYICIVSGTKMITMTP